MKKRLYFISVTIVPAGVSLFWYIFGFMMLVMMYISYLDEKTTSELFVAELLMAIICFVIAGNVSKGYWINLINFRTKTIKGKIINCSRIIHYGKGEGHGWAVVVEDETGNQEKLYLYNDVLNTALNSKYNFAIQRLNYGEFTYLSICKYVISLKLYKRKISR